MGKEDASPEVFGNAPVIRELASVVDRDAPYATPKRLKASADRRSSLRGGAPKHLGQPREARLAVDERDHTRRASMHRIALPVAVVKSTLGAGSSLFDPDPARDLAATIASSAIPLTPLLADTQVRPERSPLALVRVDESVDPFMADRQCAFATTSFRDLLRAPVLLQQPGDRAPLANRNPRPAATEGGPCPSRAPSLLGPITVIAAVTQELPRDRRGRSAKDGADRTERLSALAEGVDLVSFFRVEVRVGHSGNSDLERERSWSLPHLALSSSGALHFGVETAVINFGTTFAIFPWFAPMKSWISLWAHVAFGAVAGGTYELLEVERVAPPGPRP